MSLRLQTIGVVLIIGALILVGRDLASNFGNLGWPLYSIVPGVLMLIVAFLSRGGASGLAVPGSIVTTAGAILFLQNVAGRFETWPYTWPLVLASVGAGIVLHAALKDDAEEERLGLRLVIFGLTIVRDLWHLLRVRNFQPIFRECLRQLPGAYAFDSGWGFPPESVGTIILESG